MNKSMSIVAALILMAAGAGCDAPMQMVEMPPIDPATCAVPTAQMIFPEGSRPPLGADEQVAADECLLAPHDAIIVLGCPSRDDGTPADCQIMRADIAAAIYEKGRAKNVITTGGAVKNRFIEAEALRDLLIARGIPSSVISVEPRAEHTDENIYYSTRIMESAGWNDALMVSDDPGHLVFVALCDSNCCVKRGRLTVISLPVSVGGAAEELVAVGHYARYPDAAQVSDAECAHIEQPNRFLCTSLPTRRACADRFSL